VKGRLSRPPRFVDNRVTSEVSVSKDLRERERLPIVGSLKCRSSRGLALCRVARTGTSASQLSTLPSLWPVYCRLHWLKATFSDLALSSMKA
jgi:hypothetical protein